MTPSSHICHCSQKCEFTLKKNDQNWNEIALCICIIEGGFQISFIEILQFMLLSAVYESAYFSTPSPTQYDNQCFDLS